MLTIQCFPFSPVYLSISLFSLQNAVENERVCFATCTMTCHTHFLILLFLYCAHDIQNALAISFTDNVLDVVEYLAATLVRAKAACWHHVAFCRDQLTIHFYSSFRLLRTRALESLTIRSFRPSSRKVNCGLQVWDAMQFSSPSHVFGRFFF